MPTSGSKTSIVFFGTGPVAAASLELLAQSFAIEAVITKPRADGHKGAVPVLEVAEKLALPIVAVRNKTEVSERIREAQFTSKLGVLIDFGIIVTQDVIDAFPLGIVNSHFSLLPEWRGADPITFALLSGQHRTGVSLMLLVEAMDEGPLLAQTPYDIESDETLGSLTENLIELSYESLREVLPLYADGSVHPAPQADVTMATSPSPSYSHKITKADGLINLEKSAEQLEREVRAYKGWPGSRTNIAGTDVTITKAHVDSSFGHVEKGAFIESKQLCLQTADGVLVIDMLKPAGKKTP